SSESRSNPPWAATVATSASLRPWCSSSKSTRASSRCCTRPREASSSSAAWSASLGSSAASALSTGGKRSASTRAREVVMGRVPSGPRSVDTITSEFGISKSAMVIYLRASGRARATAGERETAWFPAARGVLGRICLASERRTLLWFLARAAARRRRLRRHATCRVTINPKNSLRDGLRDGCERSLLHGRAGGDGCCARSRDLARRSDGSVCRGRRRWHAVGIRAPSAVEKRAFFCAQRAGAAAFDLGGDAQPMLGVRQVAEGDEGRAAIGGVGGALLEGGACDARLAAREHLVGFDVAALAVQVGAALDVMARPASGEQHEAHRETQFERGVSTHLPRIRAPAAQS